MLGRSSARRKSSREGKLPSQKPRCEKAWNKECDRKLKKVLGCVQNSVELPAHRPSLIAYEPLPDHKIGGFPQNLVKGRGLSNS